MASAACNESPSPSMGSNAPAGATDDEAKALAAKCRCECQPPPRDLQNKEEEDAWTGLVAIESIMHPRLLAAASNGKWGELNFLLNREDAQAQGSSMHDQLEACSFTDLPPQGANIDVEDGSHLQAPPLPSAGSPLESVTFAEKDSLLHVVAANGDGDNFLKCAKLIYSKAKHLLLKPNGMDDTPLHCAARVGNSNMVSQLIQLARGDNAVERLLRMENAKKETALHEAVRICDNPLVKVLLKADSKLATFPKQGTSPLYLSVLLEQDAIAQTLHDMSEDNNISYSGPSGQNALHAAVLRRPGLATRLLEWNKSLSTERDENGSTPLHFATLGEKSISAPSLMELQRIGRWRRLAKELFQANPVALYVPNDDGLFPIHVAASVDDERYITIFVDKYPRCAGLRDIMGRTFLHVAVEKGSWKVVRYTLKTKSLAWILNIQDRGGNTALHLAVQASHFCIFLYLFQNRRVHLSMTNAQGQTPLDIADTKVPKGLLYFQNPEAQIFQALRFLGGTRGASRLHHHLGKNYGGIHQGRPDYEKEELENIKETTQSLCVGSVLIATVAFGAAFALPGGYRQDDGTPIFAGRIRKWRSTIAYLFMEISVTCLVAAFALAGFLVLGSDAHKTALAICFISPSVVLFNNGENLLNVIRLATTVYKRNGLHHLSFLVHAGRVVGYTPFLALLPIPFIFVWAAYGRDHSISPAPGPAH
nr:protein ACCELERATED CELL DEATH 6-like isoform X2 [Setaria viridis]